MTTHVPQETLTRWAERWEAMNDRQQEHYLDCLRRDLRRIRRAVFQMIGTGVQSSALPRVARGRAEAMPEGEAKVRLLALVSKYEERSRELDALDGCEF